MSIRLPGSVRRRSGQRRVALAVIVPLLCLLVAACGDDAPDASHAPDDHDEQTALLVVKATEKGMPLSEDLAEAIAGDGQVLAVEKYIRLRLEDFDVVGIEQSAPARIMTGQPDIHLIEAALPPDVLLGDDAAFVGEAFAQAMGIARGETFTLGDSERELTVAGIFSTDPPALSRTVVLSLATVQAIYDLGRTVTHFWVTVESPDATHDAIRSLQVALGDTVEVLPRTER